MKSKLGRRLLIVLLTLTVIVGFVVAYWSWIFFRWDKPYAGITREDTEARVIALLGKPHSISEEHFVVKEDSSEDRDFSIAQRQVVKQFHYKVPINPGEQYLIGFDPDGHAVLKMHYMTD
jgi:hypothetical protein